LARIALSQQRSQLQISLLSTAYKAAMHEGDAKPESYVSRCIHMWFAGADASAPANHNARTTNSSNVEWATARLSG